MKILMFFFFFCLKYMCSRALIRGGIEDNSKIFFLFLNENECFDHSLEPSQRDGSNDGSQHYFLWKRWKIIPKLSLLPLYIWSTVWSEIVLKRYLWF